VDDYTLLEDDNIILTVHFYEPHFFTNQGKTFGTNIFNTTGVPFPYDPATMPAQSPLDTGAYMLNLYNSYPNKGTVAYVENWIQGLKDHADSLGVPLYIGEFGCTRWSPEEGMMNYLRTVRETFETHNIPWAIYNWKNKSSSSFSMFNCDGCADTDSLFTDSTAYTILCALGLDICNSVHSAEIFQATDFVGIYPNPSNSIITIELNNNNINSLTIYDIKGSLTRKINKVHSKTFQLVVSDLKKGMYLVKLLDEKGNHYSQELIIE
jgi:hypothetical protein